MEQRIIIWFFTLKGLKFIAIHDECISMYEEDSFALSTLKNRPSPFAKGESTSSTI
jgi:hypothetical protein